MAQHKSVQKKWGLLEFKKTFNKDPKKSSQNVRQGRGGGKVEDDNAVDDRNLLMKSWSLASYSWRVLLFRKRTHQWWGGPMATTI